MKNDYAVWERAEDGTEREIGRIYLSNSFEEEWFWGNNRTPNVLGRDRGYAKSLSEAKLEFRKGWEG